MKLLSYVNFGPVFRVRMSNLQQVFYQVSLVMQDVKHSASIWQNVIEDQLDKLFVKGFNLKFLRLELLDETPEDKAETHACLVAAIAIFESVVDIEDLFLHAVALVEIFDKVPVCLIVLISLLEASKQVVQMKSYWIKHVVGLLTDLRVIKWNEVELFLLEVVIDVYYSLNTLMVNDV